jgi:glycosyltransferase involved in cell wall biosynthesis
MKYNMDSNSKRVLFVGPYPPPFGGIASNLVSILPILIKSGYKVWFLTFTDHDDEFSPQEGVRVIRVNRNKYLVKSFGSIVKRIGSITAMLKTGLGLKESISVLTSALIIKRLIQLNKVNIVSSYMIDYSYFIPLIRKWFGSDISIALTVYAEMYESKDRFKGKDSIISETLKNSDYLMASSQFCANVVELVRFDPKEVEVIYIGVDLAKFNIESQKLKIESILTLPDDRRIVMFMGRFNEDMGLDILIDCASEIIQKYNDVAILLVGADGPLSKLAEELRNQFPDSVFIRQNAPFEEIPGYYSKSCFLVAPSKDKHPCMGVSIKEAMASGRPVIATRCGGIPEAVIENETGFLIETIDETGKANRSELVEKMCLLLESPELVKKMGVKARRRAEELFDNETTSKKMLAVFDNFLSEK